MRAPNLEEIQRARQLHEVVTEQARANWLIRLLARVPTLDPTNPAVRLLQEVLRWARRPTPEEEDDALRSFEKRLPPPLRRPIWEEPGPGGFLERFERERPDRYQRTREALRWFFSG